MAFKIYLNELLFFCDKYFLKVLKHNFLPKEKKREKNINEKIKQTF